MLRDKSKIKGKLVIKVMTQDGNVKRYKGFSFLNWLPDFITDFLRNTFKMPVGNMLVVNHNIVTDEGDALVADLMSMTPARVKLDNTNGFIQVGTGWTGVTPKTNTVVNTATGTPEVMDATYPKQKGAFSAADDNVTQYRATFEAGDLNITGIDEAALLNNVTPASADCLAYAQITPAVDVTTADTLQVNWEITFLGA
jgi:hypothetical protein